MRKLILAAAFAAIGMVSFTGGASAQTASDCAAAFGALPNAKWQWVITVIPGGPIPGTQNTTYGDASFNGNSGNADASYETTQDVQQPGLKCEAMNPGGNIVADKSGEIGGQVETVVVASGTTQVCENTGNKSSEPVGDYDGSCVNPRW